MAAGGNENMKSAWTAVQQLVHRFFGSSGGPSREASNDLNSPKNGTYTPTSERDNEKTTTTKNDSQLQRTSKPKSVKPRSPPPPPPHQTKMPSGNNLHQPTLSQTHVPEGTRKPEDDQKNKTWLDNPDEQPSETSNSHPLIQGRDTVQKEEKQQPEGQEIIKTLETPANNQLNRSSTENPSVPKRSVGRSKERLEKCAKTTAKPDDQQGHQQPASESQDNVQQKSDLSRFPSNQDDQKLKTTQKTEIVSKNNSEIKATTQQQTEVAEHPPSATNHEDQNSETTQRSEYIGSSTNQDAKVSTIQLNKDVKLASTEKNLQTSMSNEYHHNELEDQNKISTVTCITGPEHQFVCQNSMKSINQHERGQQEKTNSDKIDVKNIPCRSQKTPHVSEEQNFEVPSQNIPHTSDKQSLEIPPQEIPRSSEEQNVHIAPQKPTKEDSITEAPQATQEKTTSSGGDPILQSIIDQIASILQEVAIQEKEIEEFLGTSSDDREYAYIDELLMRNLIKLDNIGTANNPAARQERKKGIQFVQGTLKKLDAKLTENQTKANDTVPGSSENDEEVDVALNYNFKAEIREKRDEEV